MIWHLLPLAQWRRVAAAAHVAAPGPDRSFVHAAPDEAAALAVADAVFGAPVGPLVALGLDESRLSAPVRLEPADPAPVPGMPPDTLFPHVYGPVEASAVVQVRHVRRDASGRSVSLDTRPATAEALDLAPHPEGGWYRQTWAAGTTFEPPGYPGRRAAATAIYYLLTSGEESCWHTVRSDELWLWHAGGPLTLRLGGTGARPGGATVITLGPRVSAGQRPQHVVPGGCWQSARPAGPGETLVTCVVSPGFDFADFTADPGRT